MNMAAYVLFALSVLVPNPASEQKSIDLPSMKGWTVTQLQQVFPVETIASPNWAAGESITIANWQGWDKIVFNFNGNGRLSGVDIFFSQGFSPDRAIQLCQSKLNLRLPNAKRVEAPMLLAFRSMPGAIRTVNFLNEQDRFAWENRIDHIYFQFDIGWSD